MSIQLPSTPSFYAADSWACFYPAFNFNFYDQEPGASDFDESDITGLVTGAAQLGSMLQMAFVHEPVDTRWFGATAAPDDWGDGSGADSGSFTHQYNAPGLYWIKKNSTTSTGANAVRLVKVIYRPWDGPLGQRVEFEGDSFSNSPIYEHDYGYPVILDPNTEGTIDGAFAMQFGIKMSGVWPREDQIGYTVAQGGVAVFAELRQEGSNTRRLVLIAGGFMTNRTLTLSEKGDRMTGIAYDPLYWLNGQYMREQQYDDLGLIGYAALAQQFFNENASGNSYTDPTFGSAPGMTVSLADYCANKTYYDQHYGTIVGANLDCSSIGASDTTSISSPNANALNIDFSGLGYIPNHFLKACRPDYAAAHILQHVRISVNEPAYKNPQMNNRPNPTDYGTLGQFTNFYIDPEFNEKTALGGFHAFSVAAGNVLSNIRQMLENSGSIFHSRSDMSMVFTQKPFYQTNVPAPTLTMNLPDALDPVVISEGTPQKIYKVQIEKPMLGMPSGADQVPAVQPNPSLPPANLYHYGDWIAQGCMFTNCAGTIYMSGIGVGHTASQTLASTAVDSGVGDKSVVDAMTLSVNPLDFLWEVICGDPGGVIIGPIANVFTDDLQNFGVGMCKERSAHWQIVAPLGNIFDVNLGDIVYVTYSRSSGLKLEWVNKRFWVTSIKLYTDAQKHTRQITMLEIDPDIAAQNGGSVSIPAAGSTSGSPGTDPCASATPLSAPTGLTITSVAAPVWTPGSPVYTTVDGVSVIDSSSERCNGRWTYNVNMTIDNPVAVDTNIEIWANGRLFQTYTGLSKGDSPPTFFAAFYASPDTWNISVRLVNNCSSSGFSNTVTQHTPLPPQGNCAY